MITYKIYVKFFLFFVVSVFASTNSTYASTPFSAVALKLAASNPDLTVSEQTLLSEQATLKAEVALTDPEVELEYLFPSTRGELSRWTVGASQQIPDFRKIKATDRVVRAIDGQKTAERAALESSLLFEAEQRLIKLIGAKRELCMLKRVHDNFDLLSEMYERAWENGEVTILDLNKIKIEHARASSANSKAEGEVAAMVAEIVALSNGTVTESELTDLTDFPVYRELPESQDVEAMIRNSAQYKALKSQSDVAEARVNLASKSRFPQLSLGYVHAYEDGNHFNGFSAGLTLPLFSRKSEQVSAVAQQLACDYANQRRLTEMVAEFNADYTRMRGLSEQLEMLAPAVENTNNLRLLKIALDGGEISLLDYLQEVGYFVEAEREYNSALLDYALIGCSLARYLR